jgi:hypothetical protein
MSVTLVHPHEHYQVPAPRLIDKCTLFKQNLPLVCAPYSVKSSVPIEVFRTFISALDDGVIEITKSNFAELSLLSTEFGFEAMSARLSAFRSSESFAGGPADSEARARISALEERAIERDFEIAALEAKVERLSAALDSIHESHVPAIRRDQRRLETEAARVSSAVEGLRTEFSALTARLALALRPPPAGFTSLVVPDFPALFAEFGEKRFNLLWRGTRDGFGARDFHGRCDGRANTLTLIEDTQGNIFGGFTPVEWDSSGDRKGDSSLKSFLFTLKNSRGLPARKFGLKAERKNEAIYCHPSRVPHFWDIGVWENSNANNESFTRLFGSSYMNDTGMDGQTFFTGSAYFTVKEIEVFEITD